LAVALLANPAEMSAHRQPRQLLPSQRLCLYLPQNVLRHHPVGGLELCSSVSVLVGMEFDFWLGLTKTM